jgi:hypothetical protein
MTMRGAVEKITPREAEAILEAVKDDPHTRNRPVKDVHVEWLASMMKAGKWRTNGEPILLDEDGLLLDGQHRLWAVVHSQVAIETWVTRGVPREHFATIDTGATRTTADVLGIRGEANSATLAAVLGWLYRYEQGKMLAGTKASGFSQETAVMLLRKHSGIRDMVTWANAQRLHPVLSKIPPSALAFLKYVFSLHKPNKAEDFFKEVCDARLDQIGSPTETLRNWLLKKDQSRARAQIMAGTLMTMAITVKAWAAYLADDKPKLFVWHRTGANPESFPVFPGEKETRGKAIRGFERKDKRKVKKEEAVPPAAR